LRASPPFSRAPPHAPTRRSYDQYAGAWDTAVTVNVMGEVRAAMRTHPRRRRRFALPCRAPVG
jgi:hypothetical protein